MVRQKYACILPDYLIKNVAISLEPGETPSNAETLRLRLLFQLPKTSNVIAVDCGEPPTLTNANVSVGGTIEGAVRNYTCIEGYHAASAASSPATTCLQTGQWTELTFECRLST